MGVVNPAFSQLVHLVQVALQTMVVVVFKTRVRQELEAAVEGPEKMGGIMARP